MTIEELLAQIKETNLEANTEIIEKAYKLAEKYHASQKRNSGEPYITHPLAVADILAN